MKKFVSGFVNLGLAIVLCLIGCASIPPETPELSAKLGNRISAMEDANITLLHRYFALKREKIDEFIEKEWVPVFAEEFFSNSTISEAWDIIVQENNKPDRMKFLLMIGPKLQMSINKKRIELIRPLDEIERQIERKIRAEYNQARAINNTLTSFLVSASKVDENRRRYLEMFGVSDDMVSKVIDETDTAVSDLLLKIGNAAEKTAAADSYLEKLETIKNTIID